MYRRKSGPRRAVLEEMLRMVACFKQIDELVDADPLNMPTRKPK
jgi:hypothetical protein